MSLLLPLGLIGLAGLAVLILIYLIKPNYQQKHVSSTFVWNLSLKYQKKRIPISKLKNLLILLCQILIISLCAFLLAGPAIVQTVDIGNESVIVIDASAGMLTVGSEEKNRFERAVDDARAVAAATFDNGGKVSVILADYEADFIVYRAGAENREKVDGLIAELAEEDAEACTYGSADIDGAMNLANDIVSSADEVKVILYTGTTYANAGFVEVRNMALDDGSEWNVAVLDCRAELNENNMYLFSIDLACYGRDIDVTLNLSLTGVNSNGDSVTYRIDRNPLNPSEPIRLTGNRVTTVTLNSEDVAPTGFANKLPVYSFDTATASVQADDSLNEDNVFSLYGNTKPVMNIQYASSDPNSFVPVAFMSLQTALKDRWTVNIREVRNGEDPKLTGYDLYVFENALPEKLPTDGVIFLVNVPRAPSGMGFSLLGTTSAGAGGATLANGQQHAITDNVYGQNIEVTQYRPIVLSDTDYTPLLYCNGNVVLASKNTATSKIIVMSFSVNYSTATMKPDFPLLILNIANYYIPSTFSSGVYNVNDLITFNARGPILNVEGQGLKAEFEEFPASVRIKKVGSYTVTQTPISNVRVTERFFVRIPRDDSNICRVVDVLENQVAPTKRKVKIEDLCVYFAAALVALIIIERLLQSRSMG